MRMSEKENEGESLRSVREREREIIHIMPQCYYDKKATTAPLGIKMTQKTQKKETSG